MWVDSSPTVWVVLAIRSEVEAEREADDEVNSSMEGSWVWISDTSLPFGPVELNLLTGKEIHDGMARGDTTVWARPSLEETASLDVASREVSLNIVEEGESI